MFYLIHYFSIHINTMACINLYAHIHINEFMQHVEFCPYFIHKINTRKYVMFLYISNVQSEKKKQENNHVNSIKNNKIEVPLVGQQKQI